MYEVIDRTWTRPVREIAPFAAEIIVVSRLGGRAVGLVANQPSEGEC
jgi:acetyl-CoA carboxylase carboxyltransferase component